MKMPGTDANIPTVPDARSMAVAPASNMLFVGIRKTTAWVVTNRNNGDAATEDKVFAPSLKFNNPNADGWLDSETGRYRGRPVDIAMMKDGSMLISDDFADCRTCFQTMIFPTDSIFRQRET